MELKAGTKVEIRGRDVFGNVTYEPARIMRWTKVNGRREDAMGYHPVQFADGGRLMIHETSMRVAQ